MKTWPFVLVVLGLRSGQTHVHIFLLVILPLVFMDT
jgi:hypothetical protein